MTITTYKEPETNKIYPTLPRIWRVPTATTVIKQRPVMDDEGNPVLDETKTPYPLRDEEGKIIRDEDGKPVMDPDRHPPLMEDYTDVVITYDTQMVGLTPENCESHGWTIVTTELPEPEIPEPDPLAPIPLDREKVKEWLINNGRGAIFEQWSNQPFPIIEWYLVDTVLWPHTDTYNDFKTALQLSDEDIAALVEFSRHDGDNAWERIPTEVP